MKLSVGLMNGLKFKSRDLHLGKRNESNGSCGIHVKDQREKDKRNNPGSPSTYGTCREEQLIRENPKKWSLLKEEQGKADAKQSKKVMRKMWLRKRPGNRSVSDTEDTIFGLSVNTFTGL